MARDASGEVVADQAVGMQISILQGSTSSTSVYSETFTPTTNQFGLINLEIGKGTVVSGDFSGIDWGSDSYFIKIEIDATGGTSYTGMGTSQLLSVPYALHAKTVKSITETDPVFGAHAAKLEAIEDGAEINVNADWNASSGDAQILNKPSDLTDLSGHDVTELADISDAGSGIIISSTERTKLSDIETSADVTDATNVDAAGAVMESDFNAGTFLYATSDNTPQPKTVLETKAI